MKEILTGRISQVQKNAFYIRFDGSDLSAKLKGSFYNERKEPPVVGDYVDFEFNPCGDSIITEIHERKSVLSRPDFFHRSTNIEQVMCANFDYVFITASLNDNYNFNRIARYVSITLQGGGIPVVLLTKLDLCQSPGRYIKEIEDLSDKVKVHTISALYGMGIDELKPYLQEGNTIAILGSSGVGKSTLVNALAGESIMKTSAIREEDSRGRHTTTHRQMLELPSGAVIIDTPGMREIGLMDVEEGIDETFGDIKNLEAQCRFSDCKHDTEPGCAVKQAIEEGRLTMERLELYLKLHTESDKAGKMKQIAKKRKEIKNKRK
ncbi:MAG: ribosome small subunit-dependent GTPase A [Clostridia bacterium]|nr:ribosome small subunit-dependent GTPase A [Clostridia bacterium]